MRVLIDIGHPAHVHLFKNIYFELSKKNHQIILTTKNDKLVISLLKEYKIPYVNLGTKKNKISDKIISQLFFNYKIWSLVKKYNISMGVGTSISLAQVSRFSKMNSIILDDDDDEVEPFFVKYVHPFANIVLSPNVLKRKEKKTIYYNSYNELSYLYPKRFFPDKSVLAKYNLTPEDNFFVLRFNAFNAYHDKGEKGLSIEQKQTLVNFLNKFGKVLITTEAPIEKEFSKYRIKSNPSEIHSLLYYAKMLISDSQTMTSEAAVLGTPSLRFNSFVRRISYLEEQERKYQLTFGFCIDEFSKLIEKINVLLSNPRLKDLFRERRDYMLSEKIDLTAFLVWFIEDYPNSVKIMKHNPDYQYNFK